MTKIKICGLFRPVDIDFVNAAVPDYIGFVFAKSRRQVSEELARELKSNLNPEIKAVGVFVKEEQDKIIRLCTNNIIDVVQLHGDEDEEYISELQRYITNPIIKAVRVRQQQDIKAAESFDSDYLLFDTYAEDMYGGSGEAFDWSIISKAKKPYFLAGGLHVGNVLQAISLLKPYCVDVSSGVETDGIKDKGKIMDIISKVRSVK
jgi:phosphoribosylanthranilate isomerase